MTEHKVGDRLLVKLSGGRIVEATIKAVEEMTKGTRLQVSFGNETALILSVAGRGKDSLKLGVTARA